MGRWNVWMGLKGAPTLVETCHTVVSRSDDATTALADTLQALRRIPTIAAEVEEAESAGGSMEIRTR